MSNPIRKRDFLIGGAGAIAATATAAQAAGPAPMPPPATGAVRKKIAHGMVKTTPLFKSPGNYANALAVAPEGLWIGQQKLSGSSARQYHLPEPADLHEAAWLVDW